MSFEGGNLVAALALGVLATGGYLLAHARHRELRFTLIDALIVVAILGIVTAAALPVVSAAGDQAKASTLAQNLRTLRGQIQLYKVEHRGQSPLLFEGTLPQMTEATNAEGEPGPAGPKYPHGPYLRGGIPPNPYSGVATITAAGAAPPSAPSGAGGWLYHEATGQIWPDLEGHLGD